MRNKIRIIIIIRWSLYDELNICKDLFHICYVLQAETVGLKISNAVLENLNFKLSLAIGVI